VGAGVQCLLVKYSFQGGRPITGRTFVLVLVFVVSAGVALGFGAGQLFEEVGILDGSGDFVVAGGPFAEVEDAAAVGAEGEVVVGGEDYFAAGGAEEGFGIRWGSC
jgi:hypothetical protein